MVIVNLQQTPKDKKAHLVIHAKADDVMRHVMGSLGLPVPAYRRTDTLVVSHTLAAPSGRGKAAPKQALTLTVTSRHGPGAPMPFVVSAEVSFEVSSLGSLCTSPQLTVKLAMPKSAVGCRACCAQTGSWLPCSAVGGSDAACRALSGPLPAVPRSAV